MPASDNIVIIRKMFNDMLNGNNGPSKDWAFVGIALFYIGEAILYGLTLIADNYYEAHKYHR